MPLKCALSHFNQWKFDLDKHRYCRESKNDIMDIMISKTNIIKSLLLLFYFWTKNILWTPFQIEWQTLVIFHSFYYHQKLISFNQHFPLANIEIHLMCSDSFLLCAERCADDSGCAAKLGRRYLHYLSKKKKMIWR